MNTITIERPQRDQAPPEWRRLCHRYIGNAQRSVCGVGTRKSGQDHTQPECEDRGHTICVVCEALDEHSEPKR